MTHLHIIDNGVGHEGLPIALLEAMSYDIPVVASDIPANLEIGLDESHYFPCGNVKELAKRLEAKIFYCRNHTTTCISTIGKL